MPNPDGTVQVAPPRISAFSPQASASAPPPPAAPAPAAAAQPGFAGALLALFQQLAGALNPNVARAPARIEQAINAQSEGNPAPTGLGHSFNAERK